MKCPKCNNRMAWIEDRSFYKMDGHWNCMCGRVIYKYQGIKAVPDTKHQTGANDDRYKGVMLFNLRKV